MIAFRPFSRKVGHYTVNVIEGKEIPKAVLDSYSSEELAELKAKKIIGDTVKAEPTKKAYKQSDKESK